ncbi:MAG: hypothetical protein ABTA16_00010 [Niallia sp.]
MEAYAVITIYNNGVALPEVATFLDERNAVSHRISQQVKHGNDITVYIGKVTDDYKSEKTCCGNPTKNGVTSSSGLKELPIERTGREFDCRINIESVTINVSSEADISSIAKELNQLAGMKIRKGGMGA